MTGFTCFICMEDKDEVEHNFLTSMNEFDVCDVCLADIDEKVKKGLEEELEENSRRADIEVLVETMVEPLKMGEDGHYIEDSGKWRQEWIPAESRKFAKNGSVYADTGNFYDPDWNHHDWYKKGKWRCIV